MSRRVMTFVVCWMAITAQSGVAQEIGYVEDFALSRNRADALKQLVPGTEDYYYYHCLYYQHSEEFGKVDALVADWVKRHNYTPRVHEILNRQALLLYPKDAQRALDRIRERLNLQFNHQREVLGQKPNLPTELDPKLISRQTLAAQAFSQHANLNGFEDSALEWLVDMPLNRDQRRHLLQRLSRPDYDKLVVAVTTDLKDDTSPGFGAYPIHSLLLPDQLTALLQARPELIHNHNFINALLTKQHPAPHVDWQHDRAEYERYLDRLWSVAGRVAPVFNSLKAHVLYHRLAFDRAGGIYNKERFLTYIRLPRRVLYINPRFLQQGEAEQRVADLNHDFSRDTLLPAVGNDEPLVRSYLHEFLLKAADYKEYEPYIHEDYLKRQFAETKIVSGLGNVEQWASLLPPEQYKALQERIDLDFAPTNRPVIGPNDPVSVDIAVKNVRTLIIKVFEINARNYYRDHGREIETDINLDGLVPNVERTENYDESPSRRVMRHFEFATLTQPGVYVIDFIGNGRSSRMLVRKGKLRFHVRTSIAGHVFTVLDSDNRHLKDASLWLAGHQHLPDQEGRITVPFSDAPGRQPVILSHGGFASLDWFEHQSETYQLSAAFHVDRESLLKLQKTNVVIRPTLLVNGTPVTLNVLEDVQLVLTSTDHDGVSTSKVIRDVKLAENRETLQEFQVPPRLRTLSFQLRAKVQNLSQNNKVDVAAQAAFEVNQIDQTEKTEDLHFSRIRDQYVVDLLGRTGEALPDRAVRLQIKHRDIREPAQVSLKTSGRGRVVLGTLQEIDWIEATSPQGVTHRWTLPRDQHTFHATVHGRVGEPIEVPYLGTNAKPERSELSLLERRAGTFVADHFAALRIEGGFVRIEDLPAGDYDLWLKGQNTHVALRIIPGESRDGYVLGSTRFLELRDPQPLQIASVRADEQQLQITVKNGTPATRIHVFATRYLPAFSAYGSLSTIRDPEPYLLVLPAVESQYVAGRDIGDEYRYIIDRKYATKYPGNSLVRPSLLLNPWPLRTTSTGHQEAAAGTDFAASGAPPASRASRGEAQASGAGVPTDFSNLDFLATPSVVRLNLEPDAEGKVSVPFEALGPHHVVQVVAVNSQQTTVRTVTLPESELQIQDLRLARGLDITKHFTEQKQVSMLAKGEKFVLNDILSSKFMAYDSLARVYTLLATLNNDPHFAEFSFVLRWPALKPEEKRELYSKYACHELNFFVLKKDPEFFERVVQPYLRNKQAKTFLDRWLLGDELTGHRRPWNYEQLNVIERVLLARRLAGEGPFTRQLIDDQFALLPANLERVEQLYRTAVGSTALDVDGDFGLGDAQEKLAEVEMRANLSDLAVNGATAAPGQNVGGALGAHSRSGAAWAAPGAANRDADKKSAAGFGMGVAGGAEGTFAPTDALGMARGYVEEKAKQQLAKRVLEREALTVADADRRSGARQFYQRLDKTQEWAENNYYRLPIDQHTAERVTVNAFWKDFAAHDGQGPFYSPHFSEASRNFTEMMLALSVLDLPFEAGEHESQFEGAQMQLAAGSPMIIFHQEIKPAAPAKEPTPILVSQNFFRHGDRQRIVNNEQVDKYVTDEFLTHVVYGCQIVVTNPTSTAQKLNVLVQVPQGAMPVLNAHYTRSQRMDLQPYQTQTVEYHFYFPATGKFPMYPVHVAKNEEFVAAAEPRTLNVVETPSTIDRGSWDYVSQQGAEDEVLAYLTTQNLLRVQLDRIAFRMADAPFFKKTIAVLDRRHVYNHTLWSYGVKHNEAVAIRQFLQHADEFIAQCGAYLESTLVTIDPVERRSYQHLDYSPLVNARVHQLGQRRRILNDAFHQQYHRLLSILACRPDLDDDDRMAVTYYLVLQDRIGEALAFFGQVQPDRLDSRLQHDYFAAYLDLFTGDIAGAQRITAKYQDFPVDRWRNAFAAIRAQFDEMPPELALASIPASDEGTDDESRLASAELDAELDEEQLTAGEPAPRTDTEPQPEDAAAREQNQTKLAATEPNLEFTVEAKKIRLTYQNLAAVRVNYYEMDVELLFSRNPFVQQFSNEFSYIRPNETVELKLPRDQSMLDVDLPAKFHSRNVLIEISGAGLTKTRTYYSHSLNVQLVENYGQLRLTHEKTEKPLAKVYVKVYARMNDGQMKYFKDGYTDLRGRFDYTSLNTNELDYVQRFAILVLSDEHGAVIREAAPPKR